MPKFSKLPTISTIISSDYIAILHEGAIYRIKKSDLFATYLTEAQIDQKIANIIGGGVPWQMEKQTGIQITEGLQHYPHSLGKKDFFFQCEDEYGRPINPQIAGKSTTHISLITNEDLLNCVFYFFG